MGKYKFALLGMPVAHSLSPQIHGIFADGCGIDIEYEKIETSKSQLRETIEKLKSEQFTGFNCTMPLKEEIIKYIDEQNGQSEILGVCNTVKIEEGKLRGFITDGDGMIAGIRYNGAEVSDKNILVFGAGATARAITLSLIANNARNIIVLNRSRKNLEATQELFRDYDNINYGLLTIENIKRYIKDIDILINASALGMRGFDNRLNFDTEYDFLKLMKQGATVADAVYEPLDTRLLIAARDNGLKIVDGFWMLVYQGVLAFEIWTGLKVSEASVKMAHGIVKR